MRESDRTTHRHRRLVGVALNHPVSHPSGTRARTILHVDMDAFFVAVELLRRPELRGQPVVVGGAGARGVVAAASYEARRFGVHSAMPSVQARKLCPRAVFLDGDHPHYAQVSHQLMEIFRSVTPLVEPLSLDEAFLDVTGARRLSGGGEKIAQQLRDRIRREASLVCSIGVAPSKLVAKMASEDAKPTASAEGVAEGTGVRVVSPGSETAFLARRPVGDLWGVGPKTLARLERIGVRTIGDLAALPEQVVVGVLGRSHGRDLRELAMGHDDRAVVPEQRPRSIGHEETFPRDLEGDEVLRREVLRLADGVARRLRQAGVQGRTVTLKLRFPDFRTLTRSVTLSAHVDDPRTIGRAAVDLLAALELSVGVRLLGVSVSGLGTDAGRQLSFEDLSTVTDDVTGAVDAVRDRFGENAIGPASTVAVPGRLRVPARGRAPWGPSTDSRPPVRPTSRHRRPRSGNGEVGSE